MYCPRCGTPLPEGALYCAGCGSAVAVAAPAKKKSKAPLAAAAVVAAVALVLVLLAPRAGGGAQRGAVEPSGTAGDKASAISSEFSVRLDESADVQKSEGLADATALLAMGSTDLSWYLGSQGFEYVSSTQWLAAHGYSEEDVFCAPGDVALDPPALADFRTYANGWLPQAVVASVLGPIGGEIDVEDLPSVDGVSRLLEVKCSKGVVAQDAVESERRNYGPAYVIRYLLSQQDYSRGAEARSISMRLIFEPDSFATHQECVAYVESLLANVLKLPAPDIVRAYENLDKGYVEIFFFGFCYAGEVECSYNLTVTDGQADLVVRYLDDAFISSGASSKEELAKLREEFWDEYSSNGSYKRLL